MIARSEDLIDDVCAHTGEPPERARDAVKLVLSELGNRLGPAHIQLLADELSTDLVGSLAHPDRELAIPIAALLVGPDRSLERANELLAAVCRAFADRLSREVLHVLRSAASPISEYFAASSADLHEVPPRGRTLATGHPGSDRPIADTPASRAHDDSVAAANPHLATKLSSAAGSTQEREHETLAEGHPAGRPLSESRS